MNMALGKQGGRWMSVVRRGRYIDDEAQICEETLLVLFNRGFCSVGSTRIYSTHHPL